MKLQEMKEELLNAMHWAVKNGVRITHHQYGVAYNVKEGKWEPTPHYDHGGCCPVGCWLLQHQPPNRSMLVTCHEIFGAKEATAFTAGFDIGSLGTYPVEYGRMGEELRGMVKELQRD